MKRHLVEDKTIEDRFLRHLRSEFSPLPPHLKMLSQQSFGAQEGHNEAVVIF
jgi:hypothetical protein